LLKDTPKLQLEEKRNLGLFFFFFKTKRDRCWAAGEFSVESQSPAIESKTKAEDWKAARELARRLLHPQRAIVLCVCMYAKMVAARVVCSDRGDDI
jgi:hypothetical protein